MNWVFLAISSVFFFTSLNLLQRKLATDTNNPRAVAVLFNGMAAFIALSIFFISGSFKNFSLPTKLEAWIALLLASLNVIGYLLNLKALEIAEATRVIPIVQTSTLFTVIFGILLLKERDNVPRKIIAGILAITGVYFLV